VCTETRHGRQTRDSLSIPSYSMSIGNILHITCMQQAWTFPTRNAAYYILLYGYNELSSLSPNATSMTRKPLFVSKETFHTLQYLSECVRSVHSSLPHTTGMNRTLSIEENMATKHTSEKNVW
jgi:hypothetical protein